MSSDFQRTELTLKSSLEFSIRIELDPKFFLKPELMPEDVRLNLVCAPLTIMILSCIFFNFYVKLLVS